MILMALDYLLPKPKLPWLATQADPFIHPQDFVPMPEGPTEAEKQSEADTLAERFTEGRTHRRFLPGYED